MLAPAIGLAEDGFAASPLLVASAAENLAPRPAPGSEELLRQATVRGARVRRPGVARTLRAIAAGGRDAFYGGEFGDGLRALGGGLYTEADLARPHARWVEPLSIDAFGHRLWTQPPSSQGYLTLAAAWIADGLDLPDDPDDGRLGPPAGRGRHRRRSRSGRGPVRGRRRPALLSAWRLAPRRAAIGVDHKAVWPFAAPARDGDTTYLCVVDREGMGVSLIQSNASGFGSHLFEPSTGINLHNRGLGFSLVPGHPGELAPGRARRTPCRRRWPPRSTTACRPCSARWAATGSRRSCSRWRRACSGTASAPAWPWDRPAGC